MYGQFFDLRSNLGNENLQVGIMWEYVIIYVDILANQWIARNDRNALSLGFVVHGETIINLLEINSCNSSPF